MNSFFDGDKNLLQRSEETDVVRVIECGEDIDGKQHFRGLVDVVRVLKNASVKKIKKGLGFTNSDPLSPVAIIGLSYAHLGVLLFTAWWTSVLGSLKIRSETGRVSIMKQHATTEDKQKK